MSPVLALTSLLLLAACAPGALARIGSRRGAETIDRCKLVRELKWYDVPSSQIPTWVCIIEHESKFELGAENTDKWGNKEYGIFQINSLRWCDKGAFKGCGVSCKSLLGDLRKSIKCAKKVYEEESFGAWSAYSRYCRGDTDKYVKKCSFWL